MQVRFMGCVGVVALLVAGSYSTPSAHASTPAGDTGSVVSCTSLPVLHQTWLRTDGSALATSETVGTLSISQKASLPDAGTAVTYRLPDGSDFTLTTPPAGFQPRTATAKALQTYGFRPRPTNAAGRSAWNTQYADYKGAERTTPCISHSTFHASSATSGNWAGVEATGHTYNEVYDDQRIPHFSNCASGNLQSMWIGFGGSAKHRGLLQQGVDSNATGPSGRNLWWEAITASGHDNGSIYIGSDYTAGHRISQYMTYSSSKHTTTFHWYDRTSGHQFPTASFHSASYKGSSYYSGASAEWITERLGGRPVRKFDSATFTAMGARYGSKFANAGKLPRTNIKMLDGSKHDLVDVGSGMTSTTSVSMRWHRCT